MGIGIHVVAPVPLQGSPRRPMQWEALIERIDEALRAEIRDPMDAAFYDTHIDGAAMMAMIHPGTQPLIFEQEDGAVSVQTKTSILGPGYHAYVVDLLKRVGDSCGLRWDWNQEGCDESDFVNHGDFGRLQKQMSDMLRFIAGSFGDDLDQEIAINCPLGWPVPQGLPGIFTPMGPKPADWLRELQRGEGLDEKSREYFVWWNRERDALYWRQRGIEQLWSEVQWHPPEDEDEEKQLRSVLECFERARRLDPLPSLPMTEIREVRQLLEWDEEAPPTPPAPSGIGYARHPSKFQLSGGWSAVVPAYFYQTVQDEGTTLVFHFVDQSIAVRSFGMENPEAPAEELLEGFNEDAPEDVQFVEFEDGLRRGRSYFTEEEDEEGDSFHVLYGAMAVPGNVALARVTFADASARQWAMEAFLSLDHPGGAVDEPVE